MTYYSQILRLQPLASWPLKETSYVTAEDISGNNIDATYSGNFAKGLPLVSNGELGTVFLNNQSQITYPITNVMTSRKQYKSFSIELSFLINCDDRYLETPILIFGQDFNGSLQGIYLKDNYIYFKPSYTEEYYVKYHVNNWNQKFHIVVSYNEAQIIMYVNGKQVDIRNVVDYIPDPSNYLQDIDGFYSKGSSSYPYVIDSVTIYNSQISATDILNNYLQSNSASNYNLYLSELAKPYYNFSIDNQINSYTATLTRSLPDDKFIKTPSYVTLPYIPKQFVYGDVVFDEIDGRECLNLTNSCFVVKQVLASQNKIYKTLGISFYLDTTEEKVENTLLYALSENATIEAYITDNDTLNIKVNGETASIQLTTGWHDILFTSDNTCSVYVDGEEEILGNFYIGNYLYILVGSSFNQTNYFNGYVSYLSLGSEAPENNLNYGRDAELYLELSKDMQWSQNVSHNFTVYIPDAINLYGSHAVSKYTSPGVSITYNNGQEFPKNGKLSELTGGIQTEELFTINVNMFTENSEDDLPRLYDFYINAYTDYGKNILSLINGLPAIPSNIDEVMLGKSLNSFIYKSSDIGATIKNTTVEIPGLLNNTQTVSLMGRFLNKDSINKVMLDSDIVNGPKIWMERSDWTTVTSNFGTTNINSIAYGNNIFVAAGNTGQIRTSTDGTTWTTRTSNFGSSSVNDVYFGNNLWIAVGNAGQIRSSTDAITWTTRASNFGTTNILSIMYGNSGWAAGGATGQLRTSTDGVTWVTQTSNVGGSINDIEFGNNIYVVGTSGGAIRTSTDAVAWTTRTSNFGATGINSVAYGSSDNSWVAVGNTGQIRTSTDAVSWTTRISNFGTTAIQEVYYGNSLWVAVGNTGQLRISTDAVTWTTEVSNFGATQINYISYGNNLWVAVGTAGQIRYSSNNNWKTRGINNIFFNGGTSINNNITSSHYFYLTASLNIPIPNTNNLIIGPDIQSLILTQNENLEDNVAIQEQYLVLNGIALDPLRSDPEPVTITDKGLSVYNFVWQSL